MSIPNQKCKDNQRLDTSTQGCLILDLRWGVA